MSIFCSWVEQFGKSFWHWQPLILEMTLSKEGVWFIIIWGLFDTQRLVVKKLSCWLTFQVRRLKDSIQCRANVSARPQKCLLCPTGQQLLLFYPANSVDSWHIATTLYTSVTPVLWKTHQILGIKKLSAVHSTRCLPNWYSCLVFTGKYDSPTYKPTADWGRRETETSCCNRGTREVLYFFSLWIPLTSRISTF